MGGLLTAGLALLLAVVCWMAWRGRPVLDRTPRVSDEWRRDHLYGDGKRGRS
jgi:hypothetical protein